MAAALVVYWLVGALAGLGMPAAIARAYFLPGGKTGVRTLTVAALSIAIVITILVEATGPLWSKVFEGVSYAGALRAAAFAGVPLTVLLATQQVLRAQDRVWAFVATAAIATAGGQIAGLLGAASGGANGYMLGLLGGTVLAAILGLLFTGLRGVSFSDPRYIRTHLFVGLPTVPHSIAMYLLAAGDRVVVERLEGLISLGAYTLAYTVGWLAVILAIALNNAWGPIIFGAREDERWTVLSETTTAVLAVLATVGVGLALAAPVALDVIAPSDYELGDLEAVTVLVAAAVVPYVWYLANVHIVFWTGMTRVLAWSTPLTAAVNVGLNFALIPLLGLTGAALATFISFTLLSALVWRRARQLASVPWEWRRLGLISGLALGAMAVALLLPEGDVINALRLLAALGLAGLVIATIARHGELRASPAGP